MNLKSGALASLALVCILQPMMRFLESPTFETARAVDIVLVFASGMMSGVLLVGAYMRKRT